MRTTGFIDDNGVLHRVCTGCKQTLPHTAYQKNKKDKYGLQNYCKECRNAENRAIYSPYYNRNKHLQKKYGITLEDYESILNKQGGVCALCGEGPEGSRYEVLVVDHCHSTGRVRGLLCQQCNLALGKLGDTTEAIERVLRYLA